MFKQSFSPHLIFVFLILGINFSFSEPIDKECENFDVDYLENDFLTNREQVQAMDDALLESLERFEECIRKKTIVRKNNSNDIIENASDGSEELRGSKLSDIQETVNTDPEQNQNSLENNSTSSLNQNNIGSNGKIPEDIPIDNNDDILAEQIKNAALKETDPERKKKIWNQYRKYKNLPLED